MLDQTQPAGEFPGLSFAYRFRDGAAERIQPGNVRRALAEPGGWIWLHFALNEPGVRSWIEYDAPIPERARAILLSDDEHLSLEPIEGGVAGVFADLLREAEGGTRELGRLRFALTDELVISGRRDALGAIARTIAAIDSGKRFPHAMALLEAIVSHFADAVALVVDELAETLDSIEEHLIDDDARHEGSKLGPVRRTAVRLHRQLSALRLLFRRWSIPVESELPSRLAEAAARLALRLDGLDHEITAIQDRARLLQDEIAAKAAADTNRHLFVLTILTAFLLPPTLVSGIFGMNVSDLPFTKEPGGFLWAMALLTGATAAIYGLLRALRIMR